MRKQAPGSNLHNPAGYVLSMQLRSKNNVKLETRSIPDQCRGVSGKLLLRRTDKKVWRTAANNAAATSIAQGFYVLP